ncbi:MAG: hypothetical protein NVS4B11_02450 [Ktedonobacteraceae bacterium]
MLLLALIFLGAISYIGASLLGIHISGRGVTTQPTLSSFSVQSTVIYAGVNITVLDVQQAQNFLDDPTTSSGNPSNMVRIHLQASNKTPNAINLMYNNSVSLLTPEKKTIAPTYVRSSSVVTAGATQTNALDFVVPENTKVGQLLLRLGTADEAQMDIPLAEHADVSMYAPKTRKFAATVQYQGLDWTLTGATSQLSIDGQQARKGMRYLVVMLSVNNTLSQTAIVGSAYDYMRLKVGDTTAMPKNTTLPISFMSGASGQTGTVTFLIPQNVMAFTLTLLPQSQSGFDQATIDFQI